MFSRKRVPSHEEEQHTGYKKGHKTDLKGGSEPRAKTAFSGFLSIYHAAHTHKSPLSNSSNSLLAFHQAEMRKTVRNESGNKSTHSSRTLLENRNIHAEGRRGISDGASEDIGRSVSSPMCVTEDSPTTVFNAASFSRRDISSGHSLSLSSPISSNPANRSSLSVAENGRPGTSPCLLNEPRSTPVRINGLPNEGTPSKGPKSKPKLQENVDVRELAVKQQLHKVNMATLINWLKKRGVPVKSKDKKEELANKVKEYISVVAHEP
ncbi:hypothetical protein pdam_00021702 [Pocillopora damicornis]|uniref:Uncharacterized protein n=1 Tax=Pocillopora damicornis TaxID=46731 RepID=A0A3M6TYV9_POCDA|nr:hypothetical protein pdam_00021702 [Pocillopora damicornis]